MGLANQGMTPGRTTLLEAVNTLLENIGEMPVDQLDNQQVHDARVAERTILEFHREGQLRGWSWNSEQGYPFILDICLQTLLDDEKAFCSTRKSAPADGECSSPWEKTHGEPLARESLSR